MHLKEENKNIKNNKEMIFNSYSFKQNKSDTHLI